MMGLGVRDEVEGKVDRQVIVQYTRHGKDKAGLVIGNL